MCIRDRRFSDKIERAAENYLNEHLTKYGFIKVVKPGRVSVVVFKRGEHRDVVVL